ncbi:tetratricopeptide repeat protein [Lysinibacter sp. HNR]|uniref:tetratricopeptide repeat protein n=1 Tax=Lysinibacter sp. HNR TaxID=3031408 RepID=UPI002435D471|nr:tetratricopeptide repeat protein [Lysinibacter sp. HNR]WGD38435.1 tetratricopeptide repeat protein [Lysinibacter sp. HNR]
MSDPRLSGLMAGGAVDLSPLVNKSTARPQRTPGQPGGLSAGASGENGRTLPVPSLVMDVTDETFAQVAQLSTHVPVIVELYAVSAQPTAQLGPVLSKLIRELDGRMLLARVDIESNPGLLQAFQAQSVPMVVALLAGKPVPLFQGTVSEPEIVQVFNQVIEIAAQSGVQGRVEAQEEDTGEEPGTAETSAPLPPHHQEAFDAIERGDYAAAIEEYRKAIASNPRDTDAIAGLAQVSLLNRLAGKTLEQIRARAAAEPQSIEAQLDVADLDVSGGHVEDAFQRLLTLFSELDQEGKDQVRERLLELFDVVGTNDPLVITARRNLTNLLY